MKPGLGCQGVCIGGKISMKELAKQYNPEEFEDRIYDMWMKANAFHAEVNANKKPLRL